MSRAVRRELSAYLIFLGQDATRIGYVYYKLNVRKRIIAAVCSNAYIFQD